MMRAAGLVTLGLGLTGAVAMIGTDQWVAASYERARPTLIGPPSAGSDEAELLAVRPHSDLVVTTAVSTPTPVTALASRTFGVGARVAIAGDERLNLEIVSSQPVGVETGLLDAAGRPLILVTARERGKGTRLIRFLVEADRAPSDSEKTL